MITWIEQRTGLISALKDFLTEEIPGGASYFYVFGATTLILLTMQVITGIFLTFYYSPSAVTAWESTKFIYENVTLGQFMISMHDWGASAMIILITVHLLQVLVFGAYKRPREIQWVVGVCLFFFTLVLGFTGYLLPWDLNAYYATQVGINIAATVPIVGPYIASFLNDGSTLGTLTVSRFFGIHVWLTPALLIGLVGLHLYIFRHNGPAGPAVEDHPKTVGRFYPDQIFMDTIVAFIAFLVVVALAVYMPTPLLPKADPNYGGFIPAPAWYFYSLYGILRLAPAGVLTLVATVVLPGVFSLVLFLLPWIDRNPSRAIAKRPFMMGVTAITLISIIALSIYAGKQIDKERQASPAGLTPVAGTGAAPATPTPQPGATVASGPDGAKVFASNCASCHGASGQGLPGSFPPLAGNPFVVGDPAKVIATVDNGMHGAITVNGAAYNGQMPAWKGTLKPDEIAAVITYIRTSWGNKASPVKVEQVKASK
ncbi:MAG: cytochrome b N-terminal domain-containing protein [Candidatus Eremiobacteraeota bacterium]|nr:cytochrome b N-terminal domain-containing protein [Candidatus Eremiobacteraeota bacterium]MBV8366028.1 cytochrome b N-terminal domain-containing protein [Candidatus Eremiobacteraeota bacterium]